MKSSKLRKASTMLFPREKSKLLVIVTKSRAKMQGLRKYVQRFNEDHRPNRIFSKYPPIIAKR